MELNDTPTHPPTAPTPTDDLDVLNHLEQTFYKEGWDGGFAHGAIHGSIEGRALGKEKAFEVWEELGFYQASAAFVSAVPKTEKAKMHALSLLTLIASFPTSNDSATQPQPGEEDADDGFDMGALMERIRARYKLMCSAQGVRGRLRAAVGPAAVPTGEGKAGGAGAGVSLGF